MFRTPNRPLTALLLALAMSSLAAVEASASTILVNSTADIVADDGVCTLREAVIAANTNVASGVTVGECAAGEPTDPVTDLPIDEIVFLNLPGQQFYALTMVGVEDLAATGDLDILESVNIFGNGADDTIIQGISSAPYQERVFSINTTQFSIAVVIQGVQIKFGVDAQPGGAIYNFVGNLVVKDSLITHNLSSAGGGGIANVSQALLTVIDSEVSFNGATTGGGIFNDESSSVVVTNSRIANNLASCQLTGCEADGGGIFTHSGAVSLINSQVVGNRATCYGDPCQSRGGGLHSDSSIVQVLGGKVDINTADCSDIGSPTLHCQALGGGIYNTGHQPLLIQDVTVSQNQARCIHDDCDETRANLEAQGGGIYNNGTVTVRRSTLWKNHVRGGDVAYGGGLVNIGDATIVNSTFSGNFSYCVTGSNCSSWGGGFFQFDADSSAEIRFSTFTGNFNHAQGSSGILIAGGIAVLTGSFVIRHSIVAKNAVDNCFFGPGVSGATNLDDDGTCAGFTLSNVNPHIGPLAMNGGPTKTHRLLSFSPAIDAASSCDGVTTDQRGTARPQSSACDLGAYERLSVGALTPAFEELLTAIGEVQNADVSRRLLALLGEIPRLLGDGRPNDRAVCGKLNAFLSQVASAAARGELTRDEAAGLRRLALAVQREQGCIR